MSLYYCVAWLPGGQLRRYESCTTNEERAYSHLNRLRKQGRTEVGMVELDHKPPGVKAPPVLRKQQQGTLFSTDPPPGDDDDSGGQMGFSFNPAKGLTAKQLEALDTLQREGPQSPWDFGSTTVSRLRKEGLVEKVGLKLQITEEGLDRLVRGNPAGEYADDELVFEYGVIENQNERKGGWLPAVWQNGRLLGSEWSTISYEKDEAMQMAPREADAAAERYVGDWDITMKPRENPSDAPHRFRIRYRDENDPGCPIFSMTVRAWDRESAEEAFYDAPDGEGWEIVSIKKAPKRNPGRADDAIYATSRKSRERDPLYTTLTLLGGTVYRDSTPIAFWSGPGDGGPNEGYRPHPAADESERETLVEFNQFRGYSTNPITAEQRHDLAGSDFAVPEHEGLPIDTPGRTRAAMARFNQFDFDSNAQRKSAYRRILARARHFGIDPQGFQARWHGR